MTRQARQVQQARADPKATQAVRVRKGILVILGLQVLKGQWGQKACGDQGVRREKGEKKVILAAQDQLVHADQQALWALRDLKVYGGMWDHRENPAVRDQGGLKAIQVQQALPEFKVL